VGVAFALVIGAGLSTTIGASAAFCGNLAAPKCLAVGLGLSAGVMLCAPFLFLSQFQLHVVVTSCTESTLSGLERNYPAS
jgi:zinc transporter ZupT